MIDVSQTHFLLNNFRYWPFLLCRGLIFSYICSSWSNHISSHFQMPFSRVPYHTLFHFSIYHCPFTRKYNLSMCFMEFSYAPLLQFLLLTFHVDCFPCLLPLMYITLLLIYYIINYNMLHSYHEHSYGFRPLFFLNPGQIFQVENNRTLFDFSPQRFLFMPRKIDNDDRNGHIASNFFHFYTMVSSLAKVTGLQSHLLLEKTENQKCYDTKYKVLGLENAFATTTMIILVIPLIIFNIGSLLLILVANKLFFCGLPISSIATPSVRVNRKKTTCLLVIWAIDFQY